LHGALHRGSTEHRPADFTTQPSPVSAPEHES
jgi:hypothetical protein